MLAADTGANLRDLMERDGALHDPSALTQCRNRQRSPCLDGVRIGNRAIDMRDWISPATGQD